LHMDAAGPAETRRINQRFLNAAVATPAGVWFWHISQRLYMR